MPNRAMTEKTQNSTSNHMFETPIPHVKHPLKFDSCSDIIDEILPAFDSVCSLLFSFES